MTAPSASRLRWGRYTKRLIADLYDYILGLTVFVVLCMIVEIVVQPVPNWVIWLAQGIVLAAYAVLLAVTVWDEWNESRKDGHAVLAARALLVCGHVVVVVPFVWCGMAVWPALCR